MILENIITYDWNFHFATEPSQISLRPVLEKKLELVDQIEELHATLLEKMDAIKELQDRLKKDYVPASVCHHLEQCIKDTDVRYYFETVFLFYRSFS